MQQTFPAFLMMIVQRRHLLWFWSALIIVVSTLGRKIHFKNKHASLKHIKIMLVLLSFTYEFDLCLFCLWILWQVQKFNIIACKYSYLRLLIGDITNNNATT